MAEDADCTLLELYLAKHPDLLMRMDDELYRYFCNVATFSLEVREQKGNFATQKVYKKIISIMSFYLDFLRNFNLYGTLIWESMSSRIEKKLMKLAE